MKRLHDTMLTRWKAKLHIAEAISSAPFALPIYDCLRCFSSAPTPLRLFTASSHPGITTDYFWCRSTTTQSFVLLLPPSKIRLGPFEKRA